MRIRAWQASLFAIAFSACSAPSTTSVGPTGGPAGSGDDMGVPETSRDAGHKPSGADDDRDKRSDGGAIHRSDLGGTSQPDGGSFMPPGGSDPLVTHAPPTPITATRTLLGGLDVVDVSVDQGGGVWAVTTSNVYYFAPGRASPFVYNQSSGLARGWYTWTDTWFQPGTYPVTFQSVAGATSGQAIVGNIGAIADRVQVNPSTGAIVRLDNMQVTTANTNAAEYPEHVKRVVATWKAIVDLNGTFSGTAYVGGFHGFGAFHGLTADCACLAFEEHQHYINDTIVGGADARGMTFTPDGDVWEGDRDFLSFLPQRSKGSRVGLFDYNFTVGLDVFANVRDEISSIASDAAGGVWVASDGNGLAYVAPTTHAMTYWSSATELPQNHLSAVAVDGAGRVWIGTRAGGVARLETSGTWTYFTAASGLPSDSVHAIYFDKLAATGRVWIATGNGIAEF
jgi:hypothetical protein